MRRSKIHAIFLRLPRLSAASHAMMGYDGQMGSLDGLNRIHDRCHILVKPELIKATTEDEKPHLVTV